MTDTTIFGNWKMHGDIALINAFTGLDLFSYTGNFGLALPATLISVAKDKLAARGWSIGAQDVSEHQQGAYTGALSASMLKEAGCDFCLVGHSERRTYQHENDVQIAAKMARLNEAGIAAVVCVGETLQEREAGQTSRRVASQLDAVIVPMQEALALGLSVCVAYEPIWAIGTGISASPEQAQEVHATMREQLRNTGLDTISLLYGGSVKGDTIAQQVAQQDINGALVGGASLTVEGWQAMLQAIDKT